MAVGRISGPLLKDNLLRNGVNLAFETNLLYLDVVNSRIGINNTAPTHDLTVNGTTRTTNLTTTNSSTLGNITISGNTISSTNTTINLTPYGSNGVVYQGTLDVGNLIVSGNTIQAVAGNVDVNITASGSGLIKLNSNTLVTGNLHATGNITADGNLTLGNAPTDTIAFDGEVDSNIIPSATNTYNLGSSSLEWNNVYTNTANINNATATTVTATDFQTTGANGLDISGNNITALATNSNINFVTSGAGTGVTLNNLLFSTNTITNISPNAITNFVENTTNVTFTGQIDEGTPVVFSGYISNGFLGTAGNILTVTSQPLWQTGGSIQFNGTSDYLDLGTANGQGMTVQQSAYTVETFFYMTANHPCVIIGGSNNWAWSLQINSLSGANNISINAYNEQSNNYTVDTISLNTWHHIAVSRNSSGVETVFLDGVRASSGVTYNNINFVGLTHIIGQQANAGYFPGKLTNMRWILGNTIYDPMQTTLTVPTQPLQTHIGNLLLLLANNSTNEIVDTTGIQNLTATGTTFSPTNPFTPGVPTITANQILTVNGILPGTFITANLTGTGTSSSSTWTVNSIQNILINSFNSQSCVLTVTSVPSGTIQNNMTITGNGVLGGTYIQSFASGSGGMGTYNVVPLQTVSSTTLTGTITGYFKIAGTYGFVIPTGSTAGRPLNGYFETGMVRYNTDAQYVEIYNGLEWISVAGAAAGVTATQAQDIGVQTALTIG
jgi:hypothetical protein